MCLHILLTGTCQLISSWPAVDSYSGKGPICADLQDTDLSMARTNLPDNVWDKEG